MKRIDNNVVYETVIKENVVHGKLTDVVNTRMALARFFFNYGEDIRFMFATLDTLKKDSREEWKNEKEPQ